MDRRSEGDETPEDVLRAVFRRTVMRCSPWGCESVPAPPPQNIPTGVPPCSSVPLDSDGVAPGRAFFLLMALPDMTLEVRAANG
jgi:hypothetical protein